jgi:tRNA G37 N-methylase Trm5
MSSSVVYGKEYFLKYVDYEHTAIGKRLNTYRVELVKTWAYDNKIIDIGIGSGSFIKAAGKENINVYGYDINPYSVEWLNKHKKYVDIYKNGINFTGITFWDSLEHIKDPHKILDRINIGTRIFISLPIFDSFDDIEKNKHYRPNEHYYYFDNMGILRWLRRHNIKLVTCSDIETRAGRDGIRTYLFEKVSK